MNNEYFNFTPSREKQDPYKGILPVLNPCLPEEFKELSKKEQEKLLDNMIQEIRKINLFPIFYYNHEGILKEIEDACARRVAFSGDKLEIFYSEGLTLLDYLFPNLHSVEAISGKETNTMLKRFLNDECLKTCLRIFLSSSVIHNMRTAFFAVARFRWKTATNYNPMRAKAIIEKFCPENGVVYDFCAGFGGRMLGALSSSKNLTYIGTDPNTETYQHLQELQAYIEEVTGRTNSAILYNQCAEDLELEENSVDLCFSCPPFFTLEKYTQEKTQSIIQYPEYQEWLDCFVRPSIKNCVKALKPNGIYCVDIENFEINNIKYFLTSDWIQIAEEEGLVLQKTYEIKTKGRKREEWKNHLFVFTKKGSTLKDYTDPAIQAYWQQKIAENKERVRQRQRIIAKYDVYGKLIETCQYFNKIKEYSTNEIRKASTSQKRLGNYYFRIYDIDEEVLNKIETKTICKVKDEYFDSYAAVAKTFNISRQAVQQAHKRKAKKLSGYPVEWIK